MAVDARIAAVVDTFVDGFRATQRFPGTVEADEANGIRFLAFSGGRRGSRFTHEFFPRISDPANVVETARSIDPAGQHLISLLATDGNAQTPEFIASGYEFWGSKVLMECDLHLAPRKPEAGIDLRTIGELETVGRIVSPQEAAGLRPNPICEAHLEAAYLLHRWVAAGDVPDALGQVVLPGSSAYLSDVVTLPEFRGRGYTEAHVRQLLLDACERGAKRCVLASSAMAERLYRTIGFQEVLPLTGFQMPDVESLDRSTESKR